MKPKNNATVHFFVTVLKLRQYLLSSNNMGDKDGNELPTFSSSDTSFQRIIKVLCMYNSSCQSKFDDVPLKFEGNF